jgi:hypothetical protein
MAAGSSSFSLESLNDVAAAAAVVNTCNTTQSWHLRNKKTVQIGC